MVVNLQGDFPTIRPQQIRAVLAPLADPAVDIATLAAEIHDPEEDTNPNVVKVDRLAASPRRVCARSISRGRPRPPARGRATITSASMRIAGQRSRASLRLPPSPLEQRERLEQLRAIEAGMRIDVTIVDTVPRGVDTPADLETARRMLASVNAVEALNKEQKPLRRRP